MKEFRCPKSTCNWLGSYIEMQHLPDESRGCPKCGLHETLMWSRDVEDIKRPEPLAVPNVNKNNEIIDIEMVYGEEVWEWFRRIQEVINMQAYIPTETDINWAIGLLGALKDQAIWASSLGIYHIDQNKKELNLRVVMPEMPKAQAMMIHMRTIEVFKAVGYRVVPGIDDLESMFGNGGIKGGG